MFELLAAIWLGILTSISPCPLATNIVAISYVGKNVGSPRRVLVAGLLYALGRSLVYVTLAALLVASLLAIPQVSIALQRYMSKLLGPILVLTGMVMLGLISPRLGSNSVSELGQRAAGWGLGGAAALGMLFALAFCPVSAALFFGSLIPLSLRHRSTVLLPMMYGVGTALPVFLFATLLALGAQRLAAAFNRVARIERWARGVTGIVFIVAGVYMSLTHIFGFFTF
jgi:cytochrome c biogenesis protein CcdA